MSFSGLGISVSGLLSAQTALDITSNNIANANTQGYTRKRIDFSEAATAQVGQSKVRLYSGVVIDAIDRIRNSFLDQQIRQQNSTYGKDQVMADLMVSMNQILGEPSDAGITAKLNDFFSAASDWAANPESATARTVFINSADTLAKTFNQIDQSIGLQKSNIDAVPSGELNSNVNKLNSKLALLANVHKKILGLDAKGAEATQLEDQRDLLLDEISNMLDVNIIRTGGGEFSRLTMDVNSSEAKVGSTNFFQNYDSPISAITGTTNKLVLTVNNGSGTGVGPFTVNFEAGSSIRDVVTKINQTFNAAGGKGSIASVDNSGRLVLQTSLVENAVNSSSAAVTIGASSTALSVLGFSAGTTNGADPETVSLLDYHGLNYTFDLEPGFNAVGSNPGKLILRTNDPSQTHSGYIDSPSGVIGGYLEASNTAIPEMRKSLNDFALSIKDAVNKIFSLGTTESGSTGADLFTGTTSGNFAVNTNVLANNSLLGKGTSGAPSDGSIVAEVADLFFGTGAIISDGSQSEKVYIDSSSSATVSSAVPIIPGEQIVIHADGLVDDDGSPVNAGTNGFGSNSLIQIEFLDASGAVIGSAVDFPSSVGAPESRVSYSGTVPTGAAFVRFKMNGSFNDGDLTNNSGHFGITVVQGEENDSFNNFNNKVASIVGDFGTKGAVANSQMESSQSLYQALNNRRESISGVSIEEETSNLIRFQNSFSANARVISIWNEVFDSILSIL